MDQLAEVRCLFTNLPLDRCEHCALPGRAEWDYEDPFPDTAFEADFDGRCPDCDDPIVPGDRVRETPDGAVHDHCRA